MHIHGLISAFLSQLQVSKRAKKRTAETIGSHVGHFPATEVPLVGPLPGASHSPFPGRLSRRSSGLGKPKSRMESSAQNGVWCFCHKPNMNLSRCQGSQRSDKQNKVINASLGRSLQYQGGSVPVVARVSHILAAPLQILQGLPTILATVGK